MSHRNYSISDLCTLAAALLLLSLPLALAAGAQCLPGEHSMLTAPGGAANGHQAEATAVHDCVAVPGTGGRLEHPPHRSAGAGAEVAALPFFFERNQGQAPLDSAYLGRAAGYTVLVGTEQISVHTDGRVEGAGRTSFSLRMGDSHEARDDAPGATAVEALEPLRGLVHYYRGDDRSAWTPNVATFARLRLAEVYPGIDLELYGTEGHLEYDFIVAPGADPTSISLVVDGAVPRPLPNGELALGDLHQRAPRTYQDTPAGRREIASRYRVNGDRIGFEIAAYDPSLPLVIDPVLVYSSHLGGDNTDDGQAIAVDQDRHAYVAGSTYSTEFLTDEPVAADTADQGLWRDAYVAKVNPEGTELIYLTFFGGDGDDSANGIAVDSTGVAYVAGTTRSEDFPGTNGGFQTDIGGEADAFVARLTADGSLDQATFLGGTRDDLSPRHGVAIDEGAMAVYVVGSTESEDFPAADAFNINHNGMTDAFIARLNFGLDTRTYAALYGGSANDCLGGCAVEVRGDGRAIFAGTTDSDDLDMVEAYDDSWNGATDLFVARVEDGGGSLSYASYLGGSLEESHTDIGLGPGEVVYVVAETTSDDFPVSGDAHQAVLGGGSDAVLVRLDLALGGEDQLVYATYYGGAGAEEGRGVALSESGEMFLAGYVAADSGPELVAPLPHSDETGDALIARFNPQGELTFATRLGGGDRDLANGIAVDSQGAAYITGMTQSVDWPLAPVGDPIQTPLGGTRDALVAKIDLPIGIPDAPFEYSAKVICGIQEEPDDRRLTPGAYATVINIHNPNYQEVEFFKKLALAYPPGGQAAGEVLPIATDHLAYDQALAVDCPDLADRLFDGAFDTPYIEGFVVIQSQHSLDVTAVYTTATLDELGQPSGQSSIDVEDISERVRVQGADLSLRKTGELSGSPSEPEIHYTIEVTNLGPEAATNVVVNDLLQAEIGALVGFVPGSPSVSHGGVWALGPVNPGSVSLVGTIPLLPAGQTGVLEFAMHLTPAPGPTLRFVDHAQVTANESDPDLTNNSVVVVTEVP